MALGRQLIDIPFAAGLGQKDDPKQLSPPKLLTLENGDFTTLKQIRKRPQLRGSMGTIASGVGALAAQYRDELVLLDGESLYSKVGTTIKNKGSLPIASTTSDPLVNAASVAVVDSVANGDWRVTVWTPTAGGALSYAVQHVETGQTVYSGELAAAACSPKVVAFLGGFAVLYYVRAGGASSLKYRYTGTPSASSATVWSAASDLLTLVYEAERYDACVQNNRLYVAGLTSGAAGARTVAVMYLDSVFVQTSLTTPLPTWNVANLTLSGLGIIQDVNRGGGAGVLVIVSLCATDDGVEDVLAPGLWVYPFEYTDVPASRFFPSRTTGNTDAEYAQVITAVAISTTNVRVVFGSEFHVVNPGDVLTFNTYTVVFTVFTKIQSYPVAGASVLLAARVRPCAKLFPLVISGAVASLLVPVIHESGCQSTLFAMKLVLNGTSAPSVVWAARYLYCTAGKPRVNSVGRPLKWTSPYRELPESSAGRWAHVRLVDADTTSAELLGYESSAEASAEVYANNLHVAGGGALWSYDGTTVVEHGFLMAPAIEESPFYLNSSQNGAMSYAYKFLYAWTDAKGQVHRSAPAPQPLAPSPYRPFFTHKPSSAISATNPAGLRLPSLVETAKTGVVIEIYRTLNNGSIYYYVGSVASDVTGAAVTFSDTVPDADGTLDSLVTQRQCYTEGGVVQNDACAATTAICVHGKRLWAIDRHASGVLCHSRALLPVQSGAAGIPAEFSSYFQVGVAARAEVVLGIRGLDEKLIVFMRDRIGFIVGDGPDDTGGGGSFAFHELPHKTGAIKHNSIVSTDKGLVFQSDQGIQLLDRGLQIQPIGLDIEAYALAANIVSGLSLTTEDQVHMLDATNNRVLALDQTTGQWSMWPLSSAPASICHYGTKVEILLANGVLLEQTAWTPVATYGDAGAWVSCKVGTAWVKLNGLAGYERLRRLWVTGEFKSAHELHWQLYLDYDSTTPAQQGTFLVPAATARGGYQVRIDVVKQKCEAFSIVLWDAKGSYSMGEGMRLSGLTIEVGAKRGGAKLAVPQITG